MSGEMGKMPKKAIVCVRKEPEKGKSGTIKALAQLLMPRENDAINAKWYDLDLEKETSYKELIKTIEGHSKEISKWSIDICVAIDFNGQHIGLNSHGDEAYYVEKGLEFLRKKHCDIIFCASRSKWGTVEAVQKIAEENNYTIIWTAPYTDDSPPAEQSTPFQQFLNNKKAEHLKEFIFF